MAQRRRSGSRAGTARRRSRESVVRRAIQQRRRSIPCGRMRGDIRRQEVQMQVVCCVGRPSYAARTIRPHGKHNIININQSPPGIAASSGALQSLSASARALPCLTLLVLWRYCRFQWWPMLLGLPARPISRATRPPAIPHCVSRPDTRPIDCAPRSATHDGSLARPRPYDEPGTR